jgi:hypothetical protein
LTRYGLPAFTGCLFALLAAGTAHAQPKPQAAVPALPAPTPPAATTGSEWSNFPTMLLEKVYRAPLRDTVVQRWRDPIDGSVCFLYIPISTPMLPQPADGFMQYGPNQIGSISCIHPTEVLQLWQGSGTSPPVAAPVRRH